MVHPAKSLPDFLYLWRKLKTPRRSKIILVFFSSLLKLHFSSQWLAYLSNSRIFSCNFQVTVNLDTYKICFRNWTVCTRWRHLDAYTRDGCKYWPRKGLVHPAKSLPELLDLWGKDLSYLILFFWTIFNSKSLYINIWLGTRTMYLHWMGLELCTGDGCKYWPRKGLVHPAKYLPEPLDLWSKDWSYL